MRRLKRRPSAGTVIALIALFVAIGGTTYAAKKIGTKQLKNGAVKTNKLANNAATGKKVAEATLSQVPSAKAADTATTANAAGVAITGAKTSGVNSPAGTGEFQIVSITVPTAGNYAVVARTNISNIDPAEQFIACVLRANGNEIDQAILGVPPNTTAEAAFPLSGVASLGAGATLSIGCDNPGAGMGATIGFRSRITAIQTRSVSTVPAT
jgi:hypothetical protein